MDTRALSFRVARAAFVLTLEVCVALALVSLIRTTPSAPADETPPPARADAVAADPASFDAARVDVKGRIAERPTRVSERDRRAFVLAGPRGGRLLVVAADDARLPLFREGVAVVVRGTVVVPPDSERLRRRKTSRTAIAGRMKAPALIKATDVELDR